MNKNSIFELISDFEPTGDQPQAIATLSRGVDRNHKLQTLAGVTGSGKTFSVAHVIEHCSRPTLVISHNKTLAAQLYSELKDLFPHNAVEYFISYYDYYQPEAYIPQTDTFIEKDASINDEIERLRLAATDALINREDVIIVASVSCIYGLGSPKDYREMALSARVGERVDRDQILERLVEIQYKRNDFECNPGTFRVRGDTVDIFPSYAKDGIRLDFWGSEIESIKRTDPVSGRTESTLEKVLISPAKHFVMPEHKIEPAIEKIQAELERQVHYLEEENKLLEAQRIRMRTQYDIEMLREVGYCSGIENYSRHFSGRQAGERPSCLLDYFGNDFLTIIDESHITLPQIKAMYNGDQARKHTLVNHGFRLPSALDNRPLDFEEFLELARRIVCTTATPGQFEIEQGTKPVPQRIRPTGILDPIVNLHPLDGQIDDLMERVQARVERGERTLVTTLTKRTAEDLADYLTESGLKVRYLHSGITALERVEILRDLRLSRFDCLVGVNLLREGLDLPEVSLVAILDADKEGFLRSDTALIQTAGRAARHVDGEVILYADKITQAMQRLLDTTQRQRSVQKAYNKKHNLTPRSIKRAIQNQLNYRDKSREMEESLVAEEGGDYDLQEASERLKQKMLTAADALEFERAAVLRDELRELQSSRAEQ